jgi:hypothetical protein
VQQWQNWQAAMSRGSGHKVGVGSSSDPTNALTLCVHGGGSSSSDAVHDSLGAEASLQDISRQQQPQHEAGVLEDLSPVAHYAGDATAAYSAAAGAATQQQAEPHTPSAQHVHGYGADMHLSPFSPAADAHGMHPEALQSPYSWPHTPEHLRYDAVATVAAPADAAARMAAADSNHMAGLPQLAVPSGQQHYGAMEPAFQPGSSTFHSAASSPAASQAAGFFSLPSSPGQPANPYDQAAAAAGGTGLNFRGRRQSGMGGATAGQRLDVAALTGSGSVPSSPRQSGSGSADATAVHAAQLDPTHLLAPVAESLTRSERKYGQTATTLGVMYLVAVHCALGWTLALGC